MSIAISRPLENPETKTSTLGSTNAQRVLVAKPKTWQDHARALAARHHFQDPATILEQPELFEPKQFEANHLKPVTSSEFQLKSVTIRTGETQAKANSIKLEAVNPFETAFKRATSLLEPHREALNLQYRLVHLLLACGLYARPYAKHHATLTFMLPAWVICEALQISSSYLYALMSETHKNHSTLAGFLGHHDWKTSWTTKDGGRQTVSGGTLWAVKAQPLEVGKLTFQREEFKQPYRDLELDIQHGLTKPAFLKSKIAKAQEQAANLEPAKPKPEPTATTTQATTSTSEKTLSGESYLPVKEIVFLIQAFLTPLSGANQRKSVTTDSPLESHVPNRERILELWDVLETQPARGREGRKSWVENVAQAISSALNDAHSLEHWMRVAWVIVKYEAHGMGLNARATLTHALHDVLTRSSDNAYIRNRAALTRSILLREGWAELEEAVVSLKVA
jgi:hypothetical protein